jgi:hypothetical protein
MPSNTATGFHTLSIAGWSIFEVDNNANDSLRISTGTSNAGDTYNYGESGSNDRALGGVASQNNRTHFGCTFINNTGSNISGIDISFYGEQWRSGDSIGGNLDSLVFEYSFVASGINDTTASWIQDNSLIFTTPNPTSTQGALDGNDSINKTLKSGTLMVSIPAGSKLLIRWRDINKSGADDGLAIDDLSITFIPSNMDKPLISSLSPADNAMNVDESSVSSLSITFNKSISVGTGVVKVINITDGTTQTISEADCAASGNTATINTLTLLAEKDYAVQFDSTLFFHTAMGVNHNSYGIYDNTTWNFDTRTPVSVNEFSSSDKLTTLSVNSESNNTIVFVKNKKHQTAQLETLDATGKLISAQQVTLQEGENSIYLDHSTLPAGVYYIRMYNNQFRDSAKFIRK